MDSATILLNGKTVHISQPYIAPSGTMVGRDHEKELILASWISCDDTVPLSPLLTGAPGTGKNRLVYECANVCNKPLFIINGHDELSPEDIACSARISDSSERKIDYILSPLVTAMLYGGVCFFDEIAKCGSRSLALLASVLDERRYIDSTLLGERIYAHPGFRFIAATNSSDLENAMFPDFVKSRLRPHIDIGYPSSDEIRRIIASRYPRLNGATNKLMNRFWTTWQQCNGDRVASPRDVIGIFGLAQNLADFDTAKSHKPFATSIVNSTASVEPRHLDAAFSQFYKKAGAV